MSPAECLRDFINERLTAAAEEIFTVCSVTIEEYQEEIDRQRRLLDVFMKPELKLRRTELPQQHVYEEEEVLTDQQLYHQEWNFSLDQDDPEPPQIKEEQEELCTSLEGEQLVLMQETETLMLAPTCEESDNSEDQTPDLSPDETQSAAEKQHVVNMLVQSSVEPEPNSDDQLLSHNSHEAESQNHKGGEHGDSGSTRKAESRPQKRRHKSKSKTNNEDNSTTSNTHSETGKQCFKCDICGKDFKNKSSVHTHLRVHTGEKPYKCVTCEKGFSQLSHLKKHMRIHTDEKPYNCKICGKKFSVRAGLKEHMRVHTGERPYPCNTCEKRFSKPAHLKKHMRVHTGEKPYMCKICEKRFSQLAHLKKHLRVHTGEKPYMCKTCEKKFSQLAHLKKHMRLHTDEKPHPCNTSEEKIL